MLWKNDLQNSVQAMDFFIRRLRYVNSWLERSPEICFIRRLRRFPQIFFRFVRRLPMLEKNDLQNSVQAMDFFIRRLRRFPQITGVVEK